MSTQPDDAEPIDRGELPIPEYDHLPIGSLTPRIRSLDIGQLQTLLAYERAHADRLPAVQAMEVRLQALADGATPSGGDPAAPQPESGGSGAAGSSVGPQTAGPTPEVLFQGVPGEPRRPHSGRSAASK